MYPIEASWIYQCSPSTSFAVVQQQWKQGQFKPYHHANVDFSGIENDCWMALPLQQDAATTSRWVELNDGRIESVTAYEVHPDTTYIQQLGELYPSRMRYFEERYLLIPLHLKPVTSATLFLKIAGIKQRPFKIKIWEQLAYARFVAKDNLFQGFFFGILFVVLVYNFFLYIGFQDKSFLYYVLYLISIIFQQLFDLGYGAIYLLPHSPYLARIGPFFWLGLAMATGTFFSLEFLNVRQRAPRLTKVYSFLIVSGFLIAVSTLFLYSSTLVLFINIAILLNGLVGLAFGFYMARGYRPARYFMLAWTLFYTSIIVAALYNAGLFPPSIWIDYSVEIGVATEALLLSLGLGTRFNEIRRERQQLQAQVIEQLKENDRTRTRIARDLHDDVGSTLSSIAILSQVAEKQSETAKELLHRITVSAQTMLDSMSDIVWTTKPDNDSIESLSVRMREFMAEILEPYEINYSLEIEAALQDYKFKANRSYDFYLIFKEAINNAAKYAMATKVEVKIWKTVDYLGLSVRDNGRGFDSSAGRVGGNGLKNMQKRAEHLGGTVEIQSALRQGTTVQLQMPLH